MKRLSIHLIVVALLWASAAFAFAEVTTKTYSGSYNGIACTVRMTWHNWTGLGPIDGRITLADGTTIPFSGSNSQSGVLEFKAKGHSFRLVRRDVGRKTSWVSAKLVFTEGAAATPTPTPTPSPSPSPTPEPAPEISESTMVEQAYTGSWKGKALTAQMRWAPGDSPGVTRRGRGTVTMEDGTQFSIEGWQRGVDSTEFGLIPDENAETYKTTKTDSDGNVVWESSSLTLTEKK
ncbi:MAG: hypothetical protein ABIR71_14610 [Chthoniobacterales bacterium]